MLSLLKSLRLPNNPRIAFVGAGGKTTAVFSLARQMIPPVIVTTTTHLGGWELALADEIHILEEGNEVEGCDLLLTDGVILIIGPAGDDNRYLGIPERKIEKLIDQMDKQQIPILIEADGSRKRPLKVPSAHEPAIPGKVNLVVVVAGMSAMWKPLSNDTVYQVNSFSKLTGISIGEQITPEALISVLGHPYGGLKNIPHRARKILLLNQADEVMSQVTAQDIAKPLLTRFESVLVGSLNPAGNPETDRIGLQSNRKKNLEIPATRWLRSDRIFSVHENIAGIILAAGESYRFGGPKQLIDWKGVPLIKHIVRSVLDSELCEITVVTGAYTEEISQVINDLPVRQIHNSDWKVGQSSSIRAGINDLGKEINGVIFILADQPYLSSDLINTLLDSHSMTLAPIIAPIVDRQRGNPVLFDRSTFDELLTLSGNQGGRDIFDQFTVQFIEWNDPKILIDIDTQDDYRIMKGEWSEE